MTSRTWKIFIIVFFSLQCGKDIETLSKTPQKKPNNSAAPTTASSTPSKNKDTVYKNPSRQIRRLTLDLQNRLPSSEETEIYTRNIDTAESLTTFFLKSNDADSAMATLHRNFWDLWQPKTLEQLSATDAALRTAMTTASTDLLLDDPIKTLRFMISQDESFEKIFTKKYSLMEPSTAIFYNQTSAQGPDVDTNVVVYSDISRPNLGILSSFGWNASLPKTSGSKNYSGAAEAIRKLTCLSFNSATAHNFGQAGIKTVDSSLLSTASSHSSCTSCHNQFHTLAEGLPYLSSSTTLTNWLTYDQNAFSSGIYKGKSYLTPDELANLISADSRISSCELENVVEEIFQRKLSSLADQDLKQILFERWTESKNVRNLVSDIIASPEYQHQVFGSAGSITNNLSSVRVFGPAQWDGFIKQILPQYTIRNLVLQNPAIGKSAGNPEIIPLANLVPRQRLNGYEKQFIPSEIYTQSAFDLAVRIADAVVATELSSTALAQNRKVLSSVPDFDAFGATSTEVKNQISDTWNKWTSLKTTSSDYRISKLYSVYSESIQTGSTDLEKARNAWKWVLTSILIAPEFIIY
ncbi:MAG: hypothetical protein WCI18_07855 [Pseudomonadota bacterium]